MGELASFVSRGNKYPLNENILFTPYGFGKKLFDSGVYDIENGCFAWTKGGAFELDLEFNEPQDILVRLNFFSIYRDVQKLIALAGDRVLYNGRVSGLELSFRIHKECMEEGRTNLMLLYPTASSPMANSESNDGRILAFGLKSIMLSDKLPCKL